MNKIVAILKVLLVWALVGLGSVCAIVAFPLAWLFDQTVYAKNLLRALDKTAAVFMGFTGEYTFSAECGAATHGWPTVARVVIDWLLEDGHCVGAAKHEGLSR